MLLADFGLCKPLVKTDPDEVVDGAFGGYKPTRTICGTVQYMAPELLDNKPYGFPVDWWGLGVLAFIMRSGAYPFSNGEGKLNLGHSDDERAADRLLMYTRISKGLIEFPDYFEEDTRSAIETLLEPAIPKRVTSSLALQQLPWIQVRHITP